jgi:hypothetical protein
MDLANLRFRTQQIIKDYPHLRDEVVDLFELAISEIEEGGSERTECERAISDMEELLTDEGLAIE